MNYLISSLFFIVIILVSGCVHGLGEDSEPIIVANPLNLSQINRISTFRSCVGHDYSGTNIDGELETLRSMKHYIEPIRSPSEEKIKVFAPFDGTISDMYESQPGKQVFISADSAGNWNFIFFHIDPLPELEEESTVRAGDLIGYVSQGSKHNFDFGLKRFGFSQIFVSPFSYMDRSVLEEYADYGITLENIITPKEVRDNDPCPVEGTIQGDALFTSKYFEEGFVSLTR